MEQAGDAVEQGEAAQARDARQRLLGDLQVVGGVRCGGGRIVVHGRRPLDRDWLPRGGRAFGAARRSAVRLPLTPPAQLALDLAVTLPDRDLRHALANLEYRGLIDLASRRDAEAQSAREMR